MRSIKETKKLLLALLLALTATLCLMSAEAFAENGNAGEDKYLGVNAGTEVPKSFTNDLWTQYDYKEMEINDMVKLNPRRVEEAITNPIGNDVEMPHFNYEIIKGDSVTIDDSNNAHAVVKAVKNGVSVVKITYDAFKHTAGKDFEAVDPVNTAYVVYSVGGNKSITIKDNIVYKDSDKTDEDDVVLRSYDTIYYTEGGTKEFDLKASATGADKFTVKCNGMTVKESTKPGHYMLPLENRSNIVEMTATAADGTSRSRYRVIDARKIKINVENKTAPNEPLEKGDVATVSFTGITMPVYKLATIYNPVFQSNFGGFATESTHVHYDCNGTVYKGFCKQWDLATKNSFDVKIDDAGKYSFTKGRIKSEWWGSPLGADKLTDNPGEPNLNAPVLKDDFSFMPDFSFEVKEGSRLDAVKEAAKTELYAYKDPTDYRPSERETLKALIEEGKAAIDKATDKEGVASALAEAKKKMDAVETYEQYVVRITAVRNSAIKELEDAAAAAGKDAELKKKLDAIVSAAVDQIKKADEVEDIKSIVEKAKKNIKGAVEAAAKPVPEKNKPSAQKSAQNDNTPAKATTPFEKNAKKETLKIIPAKVASLKIKSVKKTHRFKLKWKKLSVKGYQIQYRQKKGSYRTLKNLRGNRFTTRRFSAKRKYTFRVRAYRVVNGKKVYGAWSKAKTVRCR